MNKYVAVVLLVAIAQALAAVVPRRMLPAIKHEEVHDEFGQYALRYITAEGTYVYERGHLVPTPDGTDHVMAVEGEISYIGTDGKTYKTKYTAGFEGFNIIEDTAPVLAEAVIAV